MSHPSAQHRGLSLIWMTIGMTAIIGLVSLGVDYGRVQLAKTELQRAADAAAWAAAAALPSGDTLARMAAVTTAGLNKVDGQSATLWVGDVVCGTWNPSTRTVTPGGFGDSVQVTVVRSRARGNAVPLLFARLLGIPSFDVSATAVARTGSEQVGIIGLDGIQNKGGADIDSFDPSVGSYATSAGSSALVASNGDIVLSNNSDIRGDAHPGVGHSTTGGTVTGSRAPLASPLVFPPADASAYALSNDNTKVPAKFVTGGNFKMGNQESLSLPGGVYYFKNFNMNAGATLTLSGPATFYVTGNINLGGHVHTAANRAENLTINMVGGGSADLSMKGGSRLYVHLYGPESPIIIGGGGEFFGALVGKSIEINGSGSIHHDLSIRGARTGVVMVR